MVGFSTMAGLNNPLPDFASQMQEFKRSDEARERLLEDIIDKYEKLIKEHDILRNDFEDARDTRRRYQQETARLEFELGNMENNSFILGLIDGDGVVFQDELLLDGAQGGGKAASRLEHAIREHINLRYGTCQWPIMVQIYLSLDKLGQKLAQVGLLKHPHEFRAFAQSFNVNQSLFSIIDVGHGKERADYKIKEMLRSFSDNPTCKHIVFGGCHDAGYLANLDQYKYNQDKASRISLLESTPQHKGFADLPNFKRAHFEHVFRTEPLPEHGQQVYTTQVPSFSSFSPAPAATVPDPPRRASTNGSVSSRVSPPDQQRVGSPAPVTSPPSAASSVAGAPPDSSPGSSWATVGKASAGNGTVSIAPKTQSKKKYAYYNKDGYRLDEPLPPRDPVAADSIDQRMKKAGKNLCNHFHLNKGKCISPVCNFQHEPKLTAAETNALRYKTRTLACKHRDCVNIDCYLGHQCCFERDQGYCPYPDTCNLRASHGMDRVKSEKWDEDDNVVYVE